MAKNAKKTAHPQRALGTPSELRGGRCRGRLCSGRNCLRDRLGVEDPAWAAANRALGDARLDSGGALDADASNPYGAVGGRALEGLQLAEVTVRVEAEEAVLH